MKEFKVLLPPSTNILWMPFCESMSKSKGMASSPDLIFCTSMCSGKLECFVSFFESSSVGILSLKIVKSETSGLLQKITRKGLGPFHKRTFNWALSLKSVVLPMSIAWCCVLNKCANCLLSAFEIQKGLPSLVRNDALGAIKPSVDCAHFRCI